MEKLIWDIFKWKHPTIIYNGLTKIEGLGAKLSKSKSQKEIKSGKLSGWDDPRTWGIQSLKRRGFKGKAIRAFVESMGMSNQDISVPIDSLYSINRKMIDLRADRYSFIYGPIELEIGNMPKIKTIKVPLHPEREEYRRVGIGKIFVSTEDFKNLKGKEIRLINLFNLKLNKNERKAEFTSEENKNIPKINWISSYVPAKVLMESGKWIEGIADSGVKKIKKGDVIQFERFGFCRYDGLKNSVYEFWFSHK